MDRERLLKLLERLDAELRTPTILHVRGGAAVLAHGFGGRTTVDLDALPTSTFVDADLRRACAAVGLAYDPEDKDTCESDYLEVVPEETLVLPARSDERPYSTVFRGDRLTVLTPPAADLVIGKLKRLEPEDVADVAFLVARFGLLEADLREAFSRLPERFRRDPVVADNFRFVLEDL